MKEGFWKKWIKENKAWLAFCVLMVYLLISFEIVLLSDFHFDIIMWTWVFIAIFLLLILIVVLPLLYLLDSYGKHKKNGQRGKMMEKKKMEVWAIIICLCLYGVFTIYAHIAQFENYEFTRIFWVLLLMVIPIAFIMSRIESKKKTSVKE